MRIRLPMTRPSITHKASVGAIEFYITAGLYEEHFPGDPGELFIKTGDDENDKDPLRKEEPGEVRPFDLQGWCDSLGEMISLSLQQDDIALETICRHLMGKRFPPWGMTKNPDYPFAKSIPDYIGCWMMMTFRREKWGKMRKHIPKGTAHENAVH